MRLSLDDAVSARATEHGRPFATVLAPTRELVLQIYEVASTLNGWCAYLRQNLRMLPELEKAAEAKLTELKEADIFARQAFNVQVLIGGNSLEKEAQQLATTVDVLIGTTGRIIKHMHDKHLDLSKVGFLVLDEADRMLDLGFEEELLTILAHIPKKKQTAFFSATWPEHIQNVARKFIRVDKTVFVNVGKEDDFTLTAAKTVTQIVEVIDRRA